MATNKTGTEKENKTTMILGTAGALGGLYYAFSKGKGFWGYVGYFFLGSIAGSLLGNVISSAKKTPTTENNTSTNQTASTTNKGIAEAPQSSNPNTQPTSVSNTEATNTSVKNFMNFDEGL